MGNPRDASISDIKMRLYYDSRVLVDLFDFELPGDRIAQEPVPRGRSRLLVLGRFDGAIAHRTFAELPSLLRPGDLLVRNDARVDPVRLLGHDGQNRPVELFLVRRHGPEQALCLARPGRRARLHARIRLPGGLEAEVVEVHPGGRRRVRFRPPLTADLLERVGHVPLPPYIKRPDVPADRELYQTVYARRPGAVAAPTAGLHFTPEILGAIARRGIGIVDLSLLVGAGTFKPVTAETVEEHRMEPEPVILPEETIWRIGQARAAGARVVAVGTTVTRALEAWSRIGTTEFETDLFITPGFEFRVVDALLTNFHLPRSTLLMLVAAFAGRERLLAAYGEAVREGYRFYSYGDAMFVG
jgi:S-adenosylmethionine:tRNA ribosyltransferase-isomerase